MYFFPIYRDSSWFNEEKYKEELDFTPTYRDSSRYSDRKKQYVLHFFPIYRDISPRRYMYYLKLRHFSLYIGIFLSVYSCMTISSLFIITPLTEYSIRKKKSFVSHFL